MGPLFGGNALTAIDAAGRVRLPPFILETLIRRSDGRRIVIAAHGGDPCLSAYDPAYRAALFGQGDSRRLFGFAEETEFDPRGRLTLPPMMRWKGRIGTLALFVGTGGAFEMWNPELALQAGDRALREMAEYRLDQFSREREDAR
ncbi:MAG TPA: hypothetical protein VGD66_02490 [Allosphingosinicella sp.]